MTTYDFTDRNAAWKTISGKKMERPLPIENGNFRLFRDLDPSGVEVEYHDYNTEGRLIQSNGEPMMGSLDNIIGGWIEPFGKVRPIMESVTEVVEEPIEFAMEEHKVSISISAEYAAELDEKMLTSHQRYERLVDETFAKVKELGIKKGGEYAGDFDRLANFRRNGANLELPMETVWAVYAGKHWDAIMQYIKDQRTGTVRDRMETIDGRIDDLIVYCLLFKLMLEEQDEGNLRG